MRTLSNGRELPEGIYRAVLLRSELDASKYNGDTYLLITKSPKMIIIFISNPAPKV